MKSEKTNTLLSFADFRKYSPIFVETGSHVGQGIESALKAGFITIKSVEADKELFEKCELRFGNLIGVEVFFGLSTDKMSEMLADVDCPAVFWLDAHAAGEGTFAHDDVMKKRSKSEFAQDKVLTKELEIILNHRPDHILLLDDQYGENPENIRYRETLLKANPDYQFFFYDRKEGEALYKDKVLVCVPYSGS